MSRNTIPAARDDFWRICGALGLAVAMAAALVPRDAEVLDAGVAPAITAPAAAAAVDVPPADGTAA